MTEEPFEVFPERHRVSQAEGANFLKQADLAILGDIRIEHADNRIEVGPVDVSVNNKLNKILVWGISRVSSMLTLSLWVLT